MRVSINPEDPGYIPDSVYWIVTLDGERIHLAVTADEETGEVWAWVASSWMSDVPRVERLVGRVVILRDEGEGVRYAEGTVGFLDREDRCFTWCDPSNPGYENARKLATHFWDHVEHRWFRTCELKAH